MARSIHIPKTHLIMALCLPLAVVLGYFLAEPLTSGSMAIVVFVLTILVVPLMIKWYHPFLVLSWNIGMVPLFLPGQPQLWMCFAMGGILFALLNRSVNPDCRFINIPQITISLLLLLGVVLVTAYVKGGFGIRSLGASHYGGKHYFYVVAAVAGYFTLTSQRVPPERTRLVLAMFFLPALANLLPNLGVIFPPLQPFLILLFSAVPNSLSDSATSYGVHRMTGLGFASTGLGFYLLARYGVRGVLSRRWVFLGFCLSVAACVGCGFRSMLIFFVLTFAIMFFAEGLHRTRALPAMIGAGILCLSLLVAFSDKLPWAVQRTISFLPVKVDQVVRDDALASTEWRLQMWKEILPDIPKYLVVGKGYNMSPDDLYWIKAARDYLKTPDPYGGSILAGDYHSGPLSIIVPFGIFGVIAFVWFVYAATSYLYRCYRATTGELRITNGFLLSLFIAKTLSFLIIAGSLYSDLWMFAGIVGLAVSCNGPATVTEPVPEEPEFEPFSSIAAGRDSAQYG